MRLMCSAVLALAAALAVAPVARAQESDDALKRRIMEKVAERLREEKKLILERMAKVIDEELAGGPKKDPAPAPPKAGDKRLRDLERQLQALNDKRDDLMRDIRAVRRESEDAKIIEEAKRSAPETGQEAKDEWDGYYEAHNNATNDLAKDKEKAAKGFEKSIAGFKRLYYCFKDQPDSNGHQMFGIPGAYNVACGYALLGKNTEAIDWIEISIAAGYKDWDHMRKDSDLDGLRKERRFLRLLADR